MGSWCIHVSYGVTEKKITSSIEDNPEDEDAFFSSYFSGHEEEPGKYIINKQRGKRWSYHIFSIYIDLSDCKGSSDISQSI